MSIKNKSDAARYGINTRQLFPKSKIAKNGILTPYQRRRLSAAIRAKVEAESVVLAPDAPEYFERAGFLRMDDFIYPSGAKIKIHTLYYAEGGSEFYSASFFGGVIHAQLIPTIMLPQFLDAQISLDDENGPWYDKITLREGDRQIWGGEIGFSKMHDTAEDFRMYLEQYKRHGGLIGDPEKNGSFDYIQVCFVQLAYN